MSLVVSDGTHPMRWAEDALQEYPGRRLAIFLSGRDSDGDDRNLWCRAKGDKAAIRANTYFDLVTGTGVAITEGDIPRRCYTIRPNVLGTLMKTRLQAPMFRKQLMTWIKRKK